MRLNIFLWAIFLSLLSTVSYAQTRDNPIIRELYVKSGMEKQTQQIPSVTQSYLDHSAQKDGELQKLPKRVLSAMRASLPEAFAPARVKEVMLAEFAQELTDEDIKGALQWFDSPLGKKCTQLEEAASTAEAQAEMLKFAAGLQNSPPTAERLKALRELDSAVKITDSAVDMAMSIQVAIALGMLATLPMEQRERPDDVARELERSRPDIENMVRTETFISNLYTYKDLTDAEIKQYAEFARSPAGSKFGLAAISALKKALSEGAARWGKLIGDAINEKGNSEA